MNHARHAAAVLTLLSFLAGPSVSAPLDSDFTKAVNQVQADLNLLTGWTADQLGRAVPYNSTTANTVPAQLKLFGFEVGILGAASAAKIDVDALRALPTTILDTNEIDVPDWIGMPTILAHAKVGLPMGFDAGVRFGGVPNTESTEGDTTFEGENKIIGFDVRKKIIEEGLGKPGLTLGLNYTHASGEFTATGPFNANLGTTVIGSANFATTTSATSTGRSEWDTNSWGLQAMLNKKVLIFNPYIGGSANRNYGSVRVDNHTVGRITLTEVGNPTNTDFRDLDTSGVSSRDVNEWDMRLLAGTEITLFPFLSLGLHGEYGGSKAYGGSFGLRAQFR